MTTITILHPCSCGARPGELHEQGCDREQCALCGLQAITCDCVYEISGIDRATLSETHPEIYVSGPTEAMTAALEAEEAKWGGRLPHAVRSSNAAVCQELGLWCRWEGRSFVPCSKDTPGAQEDLNPPPQSGHRGHFSFSVRAGFIGNFLVGSGHLRRGDGSWPPTPGRRSLAQCRSTKSPS